MNFINKSHVGLTDKRCPIKYYLFSHEPREGTRLYFLNISYGEDFSSVFIGEDYEQAMRLYRLAVNGFVTPCTLSDIVNDAGFFAEAQLVAEDRAFLDFNLNQ